MLASQSQFLRHFLVSCLIQVQGASSNLVIAKVWVNQTTVILKEASRPLRLQFSVDILFAPLDFIIFR